MTTRKRQSEFRNTTRCPICAKAGCLVTGPAKAPIAAVCKRVESRKAVASRGWLHVIDKTGPVFAFTRAGAEVAKMNRT